MTSLTLTDQEKQEITRYLDAGKPLPEKYRFLLFEDKRQVELVWNGKTHEVTNVVLPFQVIEQIDEPRSEKVQQLQMDLFDPRGRQLRGWTNKLIWGDNKLILSSLKNGPLREEIEKEGGLKLIYIDPPFDVGADFSMEIAVGEESFTKKPGILEEIAYRDTWGKGADSFIAMIYERLALMRDLLAEDGSIYVHCDWRVSGYLRNVLDELFGNENFINEICWEKITSVKAQTLGYGNIKDSIFFYRKNEGFIFKQIRISHNEEYISKMYRYVDKEGRRYRLSDFSQKGQGEPRVFGKYGLITPPTGKHWIWSQERIDDAMEKGLIVFSKNNIPSMKRYIDDVGGMAVGDIWNDINPIGSISSERNDYPTQKPESLLDRIITASSNENDIIADFFCGSGTLPAVAEKLGRKWIAADLGKFAIHTTRKRLISVQRELKAAGKDYRAFEILNLGKYERQHYTGVDASLREVEKQAVLEQKEKDFVALILRAYRAEAIQGLSAFQGKKAGRLVAVGPVNLPVTRAFIADLLAECAEKGFTRADLLAFEFEMGLFPGAVEEARSRGVDLAPKYIPAEVFDKRAVEKNQVVFYDVAYLEVTPRVKPGGLALELTDFSVHYCQDSIAEAETTLKDGASRVVVEQGQVVRVSRDKNGVVAREPLTRHWSDWIDYWAVDFDYESRREILRTRANDSEEWQETWTGGYIFENEWQAFRTRRNRALELVSAFKECAPGRRRVAVKVVDIFGNDTMAVVDVNIPAKKA